MSRTLRLGSSPAQTLRRIAAGSIVAGMSLVLAAPLAVAQDDDSAAPTTETVQNCTDVAFNGQALLRPERPLSVPAVISLPAGAVDVALATSSDSYPARVGVTQPSERWDVQFLDANGGVIATSGVTEDLPDMVETGTWQGSLGSVTLPSAAVAVRAHHRPDMTPNNSKNSVFPGMVRLCWNEEVVVETTVPETTVPETTEAPATTEAPVTTQAPATTEAPVTTQAPATTEAPPTTQAVEVLAEVQRPATTTTTAAPATVAATTVVKSASANAGAAELARTGVESGLLTIVGAMLLALGLALIALGHRLETKRF